MLLGLVTRLNVTVSAMPTPGAASTPGEGGGGGGDDVAAGRAGGAGSGDGGGGSDECCGKPPHPFRGGFLHLECEPAPVPPPLVVQHVTTAADDQQQEDSPSASPLPQAEPARPRPDRAFFWAPPAPRERGGAAATAAAAAAADDGKGGFLPVLVGSDGQPVEGKPLPLSSTRLSSSSFSSSQQEQVTVPVWVRSETAGKVTVRARVVYGMGGKPPGAGLGVGAGAGAGGAGEVEKGVAMTEWARAEVLCVRPLASVVDVVSLQASEERGSGGWDGSLAPFSGSERSGHTVAVKVRE